jgi:hypothetical protein
MKKHTCATNREIADLFGTLSYSAVAKISQNFTQHLERDKALQKRIMGLQGILTLYLVTLYLAHYWHQIFQESKNEIHQQKAAAQFAALVEYANKLKKGHYEVKTETTQLLRTLRKHGVLSEK